MTRSEKTVKLTGCSESSGNNNNHAIILLDLPRLRLSVQVNILRHFTMLLNKIVAENATARRI